MSEEIDIFLKYQNKILLSYMVYKYINKTLFNYKNKFAQKIQKAWRKYRLRTSRIRNDLVLHGLAEYFYHPSRIEFIL